MRKQRKLWSIVKPFIDGLLILAAFAMAYYLRYQMQWFRQVEPAYRVAFRVYGPSIAGLIVVTVIVLWIEGAYRLERNRSFTNEFTTVWRSALIGITVMILVVFLAYP